ncbi:recQ-mediated genome instability protein 1 isoform X3 [Phyllobates terribilis]|uniref:recQ-mediated genome instability protein 1 isoform X3 n=1 Tax=Phyllobates terribilis TaxID=111132 RepID=UPI003CCA7BCB
MCVHNVSAGTIHSSSPYGLKRSPTGRLPRQWVGEGSNLAIFRRFVRSLRPCDGVLAPRVSRGMALSMTSRDRVLLAWLISRRFRRQRAIEEEQRTSTLPVYPNVSQRSPECDFATLYQDLRRNPEKFSQFCRISIQTFDKLLEELCSGLTRQDTSTKQNIQPEEQLLVTLRFLATGNSLESLHLEFLLRKITIAEIIGATCDLIWERLQPTVMPTPTTETWLDIASQFEATTQFPNCVGSLGGKHIQVRLPPKKGSRSYNLKKYFSVLFLALVDSRYHFVAVHTMADGSTTDARMLSATRSGQQILTAHLSLPNPRPLPGSAGLPVPFVIVADEAFAVTKNVLRPFSKRGLDTRRRIYNNRLSRARHHVNCTFGILSSKWRVFLRALQLDVDVVESIIKACCILHNYLRLHEAVDVKENMPSMERVTERVNEMPDMSALQVRDIFADYFMSPEGAVPWQI